MIPSININCEQAIKSYLSASLSGSGYNIATGIDDADKLPPIVIAHCHTANEVYMGTRIYECNVNVIVKNMAADDTTGSFDNEAGNIFAYFTDPITSSIQLASYGKSIGFNCWQMQVTNFENNHMDDAWVATLGLRIIGALVPPSGS